MQPKHVAAVGFAVIKVVFRLTKSLLLRIKFYMRLPSLKSLQQAVKFSFSLNWWQW